MYETIVISAAIRRSIELRQQEHERLAEEITQRVVKAWNDGQKG